MGAIEFYGKWIGIGGTIVIVVLLLILAKYIQYTTVCYCNWCGVYDVCRMSFIEWLEFN